MNSYPPYLTISVSQKAGSAIESSMLTRGLMADTKLIISDVEVQEAFQRYQTTTSSAFLNGRLLVGESVYDVWPQIQSWFGLQPTSDRVLPQSVLAFGCPALLLTETVVFFTVIPSPAFPVSTYREFAEEASRFFQTVKLGSSFSSDGSSVKFSSPLSRRMGTRLTKMHFTSPDQRVIIANTYAMVYLMSYSLSETVAILRNCTDEQRHISAAQQLFLNEINEKLSDKFNIITSNQRHAKH